MKRKILLVIFSLIIFLCRGNDDNDGFRYGLIFQSHNVTQDERTSLILTPDKKPDFSPGFSMNFDLKLTFAQYGYGYVFRILFNDSTSLDFTSNVAFRQLNFVLVRNETVLGNSELKSPDIIQRDRWMKIRVSLDETGITCMVDSFIEKIPYSFKNFKDIDICFGRNTHPLFYSTDVPPMTLRNIVIKDHQNKIIRKWTLSKHNRNEVYDETNSYKALVKNGIWEIDQHLKWEKVFSVDLKAIHLQIASDTINGRVFIATGDSLRIYDIDNGLFTSFKATKNNSFRNGGSQIIYDNRKDKLYSYSILYPQLSEYDFETNGWSDRLFEESPPIQQHSRFIDYESNQLIVFGGYGVYKYTANLSKYNLDGGGWETHSLSSCISPRYLSSIGYLGDSKLLIIGGYGSLTGKQEEFPHNFYDLYEVDYKNNSCTKLADFPIENTPRAFGNSMVIDKKNGIAYTLAFNNDNFQSAIYLLSLDLEQKKQSILGDTIPYNFLDIQSFCDLFLYKNKLYAMVLQKQTETSGVFSLYSMAYPPLNVSDVTQQPPYNNDYAKEILISLIILTFILVFFLLRKKIRKKRQITPLDSVIVNENKIPKKTVSTILMLGQFQVFNKESVDITGQFSPVLKQLFLFILIHSIRNESGVTSQKLDETFWEGSDKANAVNSRGVNIRRLRLLLEGIGDISITNRNSYWCMETGGNIYCDYERIMNLLKEAKREHIIPSDLLEKIIRLASTGVLLPNTHAEWLDDYKAEYSSLIIDLLLKAVASPESEKDQNRLLRIADVILLHDNLSEEAICIKCRALYKLGQKGLSKQTFDKFCSGYLHILNSKPNINYENIIC
jgi:DNA-binding SARP family transcriptional activator